MSEIEVSEVRSPKERDAFIKFQWRIYKNDPAWVPAVDYPAVPGRGICFRACVPAKHTRADLDEALNVLADTLTPSLRQSEQAAP